MTNANIGRRVAELQAAGGRRTELTIAKLIEEAEEARLLVRDVEQPSAMATATKLKAELSLGAMLKPVTKHEARSNCDPCAWITKQMACNVLCDAYKRIKTLCVDIIKTWHVRRIDVIDPGRVVAHSDAVFHSLWPLTSRFSRTIEKLAHQLPGEDVGKASGFDFIH